MTRKRKPKTSLIRVETTLKDWLDECRAEAEKAGEPWQSYSAILRRAINLTAETLSHRREADAGIQVLAKDYVTCVNACLTVYASNLASAEAGNLEKAEDGEHLTRLAAETWNATPKRKRLGYIRQAWEAVQAATGVNPLTLMRSLLVAEANIAEADMPVKEKA